MKKVKLILVVLLFVFIAIQFFRPERNIHEGAPGKDIGSFYPVPAEVGPILKKACFDCHSNNTRYPWYANVQPVAWWLNNHIQDGKREVNFDEFGSYSPRRQYKKMEEVTEQVKEGEMPLSSYTWIHTDAKLTDAEKTALMNWADATAASIKAKYGDSVAVRKR